MTESNLYALSVEMYGWVYGPSSCCNGTEIEQLLFAVPVFLENYWKRHSPGAIAESGNLL
jgi:hypothetical protein